MHFGYFRHHARFQAFKSYDTLHIAFFALSSTAGYLLSGLRQPSHPACIFSDIFPDPFYLLPAGPVVLNRWSADPWGSAKGFQRVRENFEIWNINYEFWIFLLFIIAFWNRLEHLLNCVLWWNNTKAYWDLSPAGKAYCDAIHSTKRGPPRCFDSTKRGPPRSDGWEPLG